MPSFVSGRHDLHAQDAAYSGQQHGRQAVTRVLDSDEYRLALLGKLVEEAQEAQAASADDLPSELADVLEVLQALTTAAGLTWDELAAITVDKHAHRGGLQLGRRHPKRA
jgi:predicted house-cleaning noncanonical NTP pyrophosphatase (MazG superfamily)